MRHRFTTKKFAPALIMVLFNASLGAMELGGVNKTVDENFFFDLLNDQRYRHLVSWLPAHIQKNPHLAGSCVFRQLEKNPHPGVFFGSTVAVDNFGSFFGTNCANIDPLREDLLKKIRDDFDTYHVRPRVLEFGPGHGFFSESLLIAGANLVVVELQGNALKNLRYNIDNQVSPYIKPGESLENIFYGIHGDVTKKETLEKTEKFQYIVGTDVIQFFTPAQMDAFLEIAFDKLAPGGSLYLSAPTPYSNGQWRYYAVHMSDRYPGYMAFDPSLSNTSITDIKTPGAKVPGIRYGGDFEIQVQNLFLAEALTQFLRDRGFQISESYYRDENNSKLYSPKAMNRLYSACVIARKPKLGE
jgi:SAM-dependent methyltransferase